MHSYNWTHMCMMEQNDIFPQLIKSSDRKFLWPTVQGHSRLVTHQLPVAGARWWMTVPSPQVEPRTSSEFLCISAIALNLVIFSTLQSPKSKKKKKNLVPKDSRLQTLLPYLTTCDCQCRQQPYREIAPSLKRPTCEQLLPWVGKS